MTPTWTRRMLRASCWLTLVGLAVCFWSLLVPTPISVILAMSVAQGIGTLAFALYLGVLYFDLKLSRALPRALHARAEREKKK